MLSQGYGADGEDYQWGGVRRAASKEKWRERQGGGGSTEGERPSSEKKFRLYSLIDAPANYHPALWMKVNKFTFCQHKELAQRGSSVNATPEVYLYNIMVALLRRGWPDSLIYPLISGPRKLPWTCTAGHILTEPTWPATAGQSSLTGIWRYRKLQFSWHIVPHCEPGCCFSNKSNGLWN